jgi:hypothetical protein
MLLLVIYTAGFCTTLQFSSKSIFTTFYSYDQIPIKLVLLVRCWPLKWLSSIILAAFELVRLMLHHFVRLICHSIGHEIHGVDHSNHVSVLELKLLLKNRSGGLRKRSSWNPSWRPPGAFLACHPVASFKDTYHHGLLMWQIECFIRRWTIGLSASLYNKYKTRD